MSRRSSSVDSNTLLLADQADGAGALSPRDCLRDTAHYTLKRLVALVAVIVFATTAKTDDREQVATAVLMLGSVLLPFGHDVVSVLCPSSSNKKQQLNTEQLIETIASFNMCAGVALMGKGFISQYDGSDSAKVGSSAMLLFGVFALLGATYNILKLTGCIDKDGKPSVESVMSFSGFAGSVLFLVKQVMDYIAASGVNNQDKMDFAKKFMVVSGGFTLSTFYHFVVSLMRLCKRENVAELKNHDDCGVGTTTGDINGDDDRGRNSQRSSSVSLSSEKENNESLYGTSSVPVL